MIRRLFYTCICLLLTSPSFAAFSFRTVSTGIDPDSLIIGDSIYIDSINRTINAWINNSRLDWDTKEKKIDSLAAWHLHKFDTNSLSYAQIIHKKGVLFYYKWESGDAVALINANEYYDKAIGIRTLISNNTDIDLRNEIINGMLNVGVNYTMMNRPSKALIYLRKAQSILDTDSSHNISQAKLLDIQYYTAWAYWQLGDFDSALKHFNNIIAFKPEKTITGSIDILINKTQTLNDCGALYAESLHDTGKAINYLLKSEDLIKNNLENLGWLSGNNYHNLGVVFFMMRKYDSAQKYFRKAVELNSNQENKIYLADDYLNISLTFNELLEPDSAAYFLKKAKGIYSNVGIEYENSLVNDCMADIAFLKGEHKESLRFHNQALAHLIDQFNPESEFSLPVIEGEVIANKPTLLSILNSKAKTLLTLHDKESDISYIRAAIKTLALADQIIGQMRAEFQAEASKISLAGITKPIYERAIESCFRLYQLDEQDSMIDKAFEYSEKSRAIVLLDAVRKTRASYKVDPHLIEKEKACNLNVIKFEKLYDLEEQDSLNTARKYITDSLLFYRRLKQNIIDEIKTNSPEYHKIIFEEATTSIDEIKSSLDEDQSFVEYFVGDSSLYTFVINRDTTLFLKMDQPDSVKKWANDWLAQIQQQDPEIVHSGNRLYRSLVEPISSVLDEKVILVPDDVLNLVSFDAFVTEPPAVGTTHLGDLQSFLIYKHQLSYAFSASTLMENQSSKRIKVKRFLGIAPKMQEGFNLLGEWFDRLDNNVEQVEQAGRLFPQRNIIESPGALTSFSDLAQKYNVIHCATHALANNKDGDLSFILFGEKESDVLYAKDIYAAELDADMVVLSACQTSAGELNRGEGIISLARSFTYAGASSVVTSLWSVREIVTNEIIHEFYLGLKSGKSKDQALRMAKRSYLDQQAINDASTAHPYFWAPLIIIGDTDNTFGYRQNIPILILVALALFATILLYLKRAR